MSVYDSVILSEEEIKAALHEARVKKYFYEKNRSHWEPQETGKTKLINYLPQNSGVEQNHQPSDYKQYKC